MPSAVPYNLKEALGPEASNELADYVAASVREHAVPRDEYREVLSRLDVVEVRLDGLGERIDGLEKRIDGLDRRFDQMDLRFDQMNQRFDQLNAQFNERLDGVNERIDKMTRWTVSTIALFGTIFAVLMAIATFG